MGHRRPKRHRKAIPPVKNELAHQLTPRLSPNKTLRHKTGKETLFFFGHLLDF